MPKPLLNNFPPEEYELTEFYLKQMTIIWLIWERILFYEFYNRKQLNKKNNIF